MSRGRGRATAEVVSLFARFAISGGVAMLPDDMSTCVVLGVGLSGLAAFLFGSVLSNVPLRNAGQNSGSGYNTRVLGYDSARGEVCCWPLPPNLT